PAVHRGGVEGGQVGEGGERGGQGEAEGGVEGDGLRGQMAGASGGTVARGACGDVPCLAPVGGVVARRTAGGARGPAVAGAVGWFLHEGERLLDVEVIGVLIGPGGTRGHSASARVSAVAAEDASGVALSG